MTSAAESAPRRFHTTVLFLLGNAVFAVIYCQAPLYYSNQNQYFLQGLARAGEGQLANDWLANTRDPTPVFSLLVTFTARFLSPWIFHVYYALLQGIYAAAMLGLFVFLVGKDVAARRWPVFLGLFLLFHSAQARWCAFHWLEKDYPWYFQAGLAGQYILGPMFQPSTFGVLLVVAICLFVRGRPYVAGFCIALASTFHSTYLLAGGLLTLGFLAALCKEKQFRQAILLGVWTLSLVLPVTVYVLLAFRPTSSEAFAQAQSILANFRIPHHTRPDLWFDSIAGLQIGWILLSLFLVRRTRLFLVLAVPFAAASLLTLLQVLTGGNTLALLFPWRLSAVLVPIATTIVLSRLASLAIASLDRPAARYVVVAVVASLVTGSLWIMGLGQAFNSNDEELQVMAFVRDSLEPGDLYFIPVRVPDLVGSTRGGISSDFKPLPDKKVDPKLIPVDLQRFRLSTGAPIFVDFKSIPYLDQDVLEWRKRIDAAVSIQEKLRIGQLEEALAELGKYGVTHLIVRTQQKLTHPRLNPVHVDKNYRVYRLQNSPLARSASNRSCKPRRWHSGLVSGTLPSCI
jgi:hypothetical protein